MSIAGLRWRVNTRTEHTDAPPSPTNGQIMGIVIDDEHDTQSQNGTLSVPSEAPEAASVNVVSAIATALDEDPTTMDPLYETIDSDALDRLLETDVPIEVVFEYRGHAIEVDGDGTVTVDGTEYDTA